MVAVAPGEVFNFLALSAFPNEGPILTAWRPGAGVQGTEPLEPAMVVTRREQGTVTIGPLGKPADILHGAGRLLTLRPQPHYPTNSPSLERTSP